jgi:O-antigen/teichoic acid export membrane protein
VTGEPSAGAVGVALRERPFRRRVLVNSAVTITGSGWAILLTLVTYPLVLDGLGATAFGVWALLQTFSAFTGWASLSDLGVTTAAHHHLARREAVDDVPGAARVATAVMVLVAAGGLAFAALVVTVVAPLLPAVLDVPSGLVDASRTATVLFGVQVAADGLTRGSQAALEGANRIDLARGLDSVRRTAVAVATAVVAQVSGGLVAVATCSLLVSLPFAPAGVFLVARRCPGGLGRWSAADARALLTFGRSALLLRSTGVLHRSMDRLVVGVVLGPAAVTVVDAAAQVQAGADTVLGASSYAVTPAASWIDARQDPGALRALAVSGTRLSLAATLPFVVIPAVLAVPLVALWLGDSGAGVAALVPLALAYTLVNAPVQVLSNLLVGIGRVSAVLRPALLAVVVNLVVTAALVGPLGPKGAFLGSLVGAAVLVPPLLRAGCLAVGMPAGAFFDQACRAPLVAGGWAIVGAASVALAPFGDLLTVVAGGVAGLVAYGAAVAPVLELRERARRGQTAAGPADGDG